MASARVKGDRLPMSTTQIAAALYQLQQLDFELERISNEQQTVATSLQGNAALQQLRAEQKTAQKQLQSALQAQRDAEWTLEDLGRRINAGKGTANSYGTGPGGRSLGHSKRRPAGTT